MKEQTNLPGTDLRAFANEYNQGLTKREYACIHLKVPESGTEWLDELINKSLRDDFSKLILPKIFDNDRISGCAQFEYENYISGVPQTSYEIADAMLQERNKP